MDELKMSDTAEASVTRGAPVVASWLVRIVARAEGGSALPPTNEQLEHAVETMVAGSWQGLTVTAHAERTDR